MKTARWKPRTVRQPAWSIPLVALFLGCAAAGTQVVDVSSLDSPRESLDSLSGLHQELDRSLAAGDWPSEVRSRLALGRAYGLLGGHLSAADQYRAAISRLCLHTDEIAAAPLLTTLSDNLQELGQPETAAAILNETSTGCGESVPAVLTEAARTLQTQITERQALTQGWDGSAQTLWDPTSPPIDPMSVDTEDPEIGRLLAEADALLEGIANTMQRFTLSDRAFSSWERGDLHGAEALLEESLALSEQADDDLHIMSSLAPLGLTQTYLGRLEAAKTSFDRLATLAETLHSPSYQLQAAAAQALLALMGDDLDEAKARYADLKSLAGSMEGQNGSVGYQELADATLAILDEDFDAAVSALARSWRALVDEYAATGVQGALYGTLYETMAWTLSSAGRHAEALELSWAALEMTASSSSVWQRAGALETLGRALLLAGDAQAAEWPLRAAIREYEAVRRQLDDTSKVAIFDMVTVVHEILQEALVARGAIADALEVAEASRARALAEALGPIDGKGGAAAGWTADEMRRIARDTDSTLLVYSIVYDTGRPVLPGRIRGAQARSEASLQAWVVRPDRERLGFVEQDLGSLGPEGGLAGVVAALHRRLGGDIEQRGAARIRKAGRERPILEQLYQLLIEPLKAHLPPSDSRLMILPQGPLYQVPFAALVDSDGDFLIEDFTLSMAPSAAVLDALRTPRTIDAAANEALVVGEPTPTPVLDDEEPFSNLPHANREARVVGEHWRVTPLLAGQATESAVLSRLPTARIFHFAGHGVWNDIGLPGPPGALVLAPSDHHDGLLSAGEIASLRLRADLVVLSACDTGRGRLTSDGVVGLARAFLTAGARGVVVSLWPIHDGSTAELMTDFYSTLDRHETPEAALRQAMRRKANTEPVVRWAGFTVLGRPTIPTSWRRTEAP